MATFKRVDNNRVSDTLETFNDLPIATPACGGTMSWCPQQVSKTCFVTQCTLQITNDIGLCAKHLAELRGETTA